MGGQNLERANIDRPMLRNFENANIKITQVELFDLFIVKLFFYVYFCFNYSNTQNKYMLIYQIINVWNS